MIVRILVLVLMNFATLPFAQGSEKPIRGISFSIDPRFPLGTDQVNLPLKRASLNGFNAVFLEIPLLMKGDSTSDLDAVTLRPGSTRELESFIRRAKDFSFKVFFHLELVDKDRAHIIKEVSRRKVEVLYENFRRIYGYYAKIADKDGVDGLVLPLGIDSMFCGNKNLNDHFLKWSELVYHGKTLRLESFWSCHSRQKNGKHLLNPEFSNYPNQNIQIDDFRQFGIEPVVRRVEGGREKVFMGLGVAANGEGQLGYWQKTLEAFKKEQLLENKKISFVVRGYSSDPIDRGPFDETFSIFEKPSEEFISEWMRGN